MVRSSSPDACSQRDPVLTARIETISQLGESLSDRIAIMDRQFNILYTNHTYRPAEASTRSPSEQTKCYHIFARRTDRCAVCPAAQAFENPSREGSSCAIGSETRACGIQRAVPLLGENRQVASMLILLEKPAPSNGLARMPASEEAAPPTVREQLDELIGRSPAMQQLFDMITLIADSSATVLIQGESGTGKELVAKSIHRLSNRRRKPFVVVDCGSLPETLLESELFGHVKGAFTGAVANKRGLFEEADGGTILLDEIANTSQTFQAKLLRVLQEGEIRRVGSNQPIKIDARVISATNKNLTELVSVKQFRQDLYYRLAVLPLYLPPLRERKEDIALLVERFLMQSCAKHGQPGRHVSDEVMCRLTESPWPGNVRELKHYIERAVITTIGPALTCQDIVAKRTDSPALDLRSVSRGAMRQVERAQIVQALALTHGNRLKAAKYLKISRASLYNKIRSYSIR